MRTQDVVLVLLVVIVLFLLFRKAVSSFTSTDVQTFQSNFPYSGAMGSDTQNISNFYVASLNEQPLMPIVNTILSSAPSNVAQPLVPYTSESQIATMFNTAFSNGESGLTFTDRYLLRYVTVTFISLLPQVQTLIGTVTWGAQGVPNIANEVLSNGQSVKDNMKIIFQMFQTLGGSSPTQAVVTQFNSILPPSLQPFTSVQDMNTRIQAVESSRGTTGDPTMVFVYKYIMVGPAYLVWVAQNQFKLDPNFKCFNALSTPQPPLQVTPTPATPAP